MEVVIPFRGDMSLCQTKGKNDIAWLSNKKKMKNGYTYIHIGFTDLGISSNSYGTVHLPFVLHTWHTQRSAS
jgi:hypothetical protein